MQENNYLMATTFDQWNRDVFENIHKKKRKLLAQIDGVQKAISLKGLLSLTLNK